MPLHLVHFNTWDRVGGAGRAAFRLHQSLRAQGIDSRLLVRTSTASDPNVVALRETRRTLWDKGLHRSGLQYVWYPDSPRLRSHPWVAAADILHLHNLHGEPGYLPVLALPSVSRGRPVVWTLHDTWPLTGHCVYPYECTRWRTGCGACPHLGDPPALVRDTTALLWRIKRFAYRHTRLAFVAPSQWLGELARTSPLLAGAPVHVIPNGVDLRVFQPRVRAEARAELGLPGDAPLVFWTGDPAQDYRKGGDFLAPFLARALNEPAPLSVLLLSNEGEPEAREGCVRVLRRPRVSAETEMSLYYAAADVVVLPSRADNLPNVAVESLACGTPVVAFEVGGVPEVVRPGQTGLLARPGDVESLLGAVGDLLKSPAWRAELGIRARRMAEAEYDVRTMAQRYVALYLSLLAASTAPADERELVQ